MNLGAALETREPNDKGFRARGVIAQAADPTYATLAVEYIIGGTSCGLADNGTGTLSKTAVNVVVHRSGEKPAINPVMHSLFDKIRELLAAER